MSFGTTGGGARERSQAFFSQGVQYASQGSFSDALQCWQQALDLCEQAGNRASQPTVLDRMAQALHRLGEPSRAMQHWQRALDIATQLGDVNGQGCILHSVALFLEAQGQHAAAMERCRQALPSLEQTRDFPRLASAYSLLTRLAYAQRDLDTAIQAAQREIFALQQPPMGRGSEAALATALQGLALFHFERKELDRSVQLSQQAFELRQRLGDLPGSALSLSNLATCLAMQGQAPRALAAWEQTLHIYEQTGDVRNYAASLQSMASLASRLPDGAYALSLWERLLALHERQGDRAAMAHVLTTMGRLCFSRGDWARASRFWTRALVFHEELGDTSAQAVTLHFLGECSLMQGEALPARKYLEQCLALQKKHGGEAKNRGATLCNLATAVSMSGDIPGALMLWQQALDLYQQLGDEQGRSLTLTAIARATARRDAPPQAAGPRPGTGLPPAELAERALALHQRAHELLNARNFDEAFECWRETDAFLEAATDVRVRAEILNRLAEVSARFGDASRALGMRRQAAMLFAQGGDVRNHAAMLHAMAALLFQQGDAHGGSQHLSQAIEVLEKAGDVRGQFLLVNLAGRDFSIRGQDAQALPYLERALRLNDTLGDVKERAAVLHNLAIVVSNLKDAPRAAKLWQEVLELHERQGNAAAAAAALHNMALHARDTGDLGRSRALWLRAAPLFATDRQWAHLVETLNNAVHAPTREDIGLLAQALWLALRVPDVHPELALVLTQKLIQVMTTGWFQAPLLAATADLLIQERARQDPGYLELAEVARRLREACGPVRELLSAEGVASQVPAVLQGLERLVAEGSWLFQRGSV